MDISLVMIVKNEEGGLKRAVDSARPLINKVIVGVDSSSSDSTLEIAKEIGDDVYQFTWEDDFSKARNAALSRSDSDWNLILDGHEYITQFPELDLLDIPVGTDSMRAEIIMESGEVSSSERILRNGVTYKNAIHNEPETKRPLLLSDLKIKHDRTVQDKETVLERNRQRAELLEKNLTDNSFRSHWYLGQLYRGMDIKRAIYHYEKALRCKGGDEMKPSVKYYLSQMLYEDGKTQKALDILDEPLMEFGYLKGLISLREKQPGKAVFDFISALETEKIKHASRPVCDIEFAIYDALSQAFYETKQYRLAKASAQCALEYKFDERVSQNVSAYMNARLATEEKGAEYYDSLFKGEYDTSRYLDTYSLVLKLLKKMGSKNVLEVGCGVGTLGKMIIKEGYEYTGFDFSKEAIKHCDSDLFRVGDAYNKEEYMGEFDTVVMTEVLEHLDDLRVLSLLPKGVKIIGSVPTFGDVSHLRLYSDAQEDIVNRFKKYCRVDKTYYSEKSGLFVFVGVIQ